MAKTDKWIHNFSIKETQTHHNGYTIYRITSIIFPVYRPEALSCITVWKRYSDVKKLHKQMARKIRDDPRFGKNSLPRLIADRKQYFRRFDRGVIEERRDFIIRLLEFISEYPALYSSQIFISFLQGGHTPHASPKKQTNGVDQVDGLCDDLTFAFQNKSAFIDPNREESNLRESDSMSEEQTSHSISEDAVSLSINSSHQVQSEISQIVIESPANVETRTEIVGSDYLIEGAQKFNEALQLEVNDRFEVAFEVYKQGIDILLAGIKTDSDEIRRKLAKQNVSKYLTRAENLQENFIIPRLKMQQNGQNLTLELPLSHLAKYKVVKILADNVMSVQDVTTKKFYVIKSIDKPDDTTEIGMEVFLVQTLVPFMVSLIAYFQTDFAVFLLLQSASGGKLIDYIESYEPETEPIPEEISETEEGHLNNEGVLSDNVKASFNTAESYESDYSVVSGTGYDSGYVEFAQQADEIDKMPSIEDLSEDFDVLQILTCSKKLLKSVQNTLDQSKHVKLDTVDLKPDNNSLVPPTKPIENEIPTESVVKQKIPEGCIKQWARELVISIDALHAQNIILGDLSIDNLLLGSAGQLLLTYFYSRFERKKLFSFSQKALKGLFVAPERPIVEKSDWWSFGVILYELLTGIKFVESHPGGMWFYHEIQFPDSPEAELSEESISLLNGLLQKDPKERFGIDEIYVHPFFDETDWIDLRKKGLEFFI